MNHLTKTPFIEKASIKEVVRISRKTGKSIIFLSIILAVIGCALFVLNLLGIHFNALQIKIFYLFLFVYGFYLTVEVYDLIQAIDRFEKELSEKE